ncbi:hypothetical protein AAA806_002009 [Vibrio cholerae]
MHNELQRPFTSVHSRSAIEREIEMAETLIEHQGTSMPDSTFEDGYISALKFVLNYEASNVREEFEELMEELKSRGEAA